MNATAIDTGDHVHHGPTGEDWIVACVRGNKLSWCGWPEGMAELSDCTLLERATPAARDKLLADLAAVVGNDHRARYARERLAGKES